MAWNNPWQHVWRNSAEKTNSSKNVRYKTRGDTHTENLGEWGSLSGEKQGESTTALNNFCCVCGHRDPHTKVKTIASPQPVTPAPPNYLNKCEQISNCNKNSQMVSGDLLINTASFQMEQDYLPPFSLSKSNKWALFKGRSSGMLSPRSEMRVQIKWQHFYYRWLQDHLRAYGESGRRAGAHQGKQYTKEHVTH